MVFLKNCEPELSYIQAELFKMCQREYCFGDCWKVSSVVLAFKNVEERSTVLEKKSSFKSWGLPSKLDWGSYIISITKNASKKVGALICSMMEYCCHVWAGAPICYLGLFPSYINGYAGLPVFHLLPLWNPWLIIKM